MHARHHPRLSADLAAFLALFLVLQAMVGGLAMGASAGPAFGIDCTTDGASAPSSLPGSLPHSSADCCTFGCPMVGGTVATAPEFSASVPAGIGFATRPVPARAVLALRGELFPQHTRAPPRRV